MKVYLVTYESHVGSYGSESHLLGIFSNKEDADKAVEKYISNVEEAIKNYKSGTNTPDEDEDFKNLCLTENKLDDFLKPNIKEVELDKIYGIFIRDYFDSICIPKDPEIIYLGGYVE